MFHFRTSIGPLDLAFTDRVGGVDVVAVAELAPDALLCAVEQVHGDVVVLAEPGTRAAADGVVTARRDVVLSIRAADCVPVLLADPAAGVVAAAHAGRKGLQLGVVPATVSAMRDLGAESVTAWIGPHICGACYEVPADMRDEVSALVPAARATTSWGTPSLDIGAGVRSQLEALGVPVTDVSVCTRETLSLHSYRRDGDASGRHAGLIRLRETR